MQSHTKAIVHNADVSRNNCDVTQSNKKYPHTGSTDRAFGKLEMNNVESGPASQECIERNVNRAEEDNKSVPLSQSFAEVAKRSYANSFGGSDYYGGLSISMLIMKEIGAQVRHLWQV